MKDNVKRGVISILILLLITAGCQYLPESLSNTLPNESPLAFINSISPAEAAFAETVTFSGYGEDSDGTIVAYRWYSDLDGQLSVKPDFRSEALSEGTHTITFRVQDNNGAWSQDETSILLVKPQTTPLPVVELFMADPATITTGQPSILKWKVSGADSISIDEDIGAVAGSGTTTVSPSATTTYSLSAINSYGTVQTKVTITVSDSSSESGWHGVVLSTIADEDGTLVKYTSSYEKLPVPCAGDNDINLAHRAFLSFDISTIPANAVIQEAILDLSECTITGDPTYVKGQHGNMGAVEVYHYQYGDYDTLDRTDYLKSAQLTANGSFQNYPLQPWRWDIKKADDGEPVIQQLVNSGASRCQFKIQFFTSTNWDGIADMICFEQATLTIRYLPP